MSTRPPPGRDLTERLAIVVSILEKHGDMIAVEAVKEAAEELRKADSRYSTAVGSRLEWRHAAEENERRSLTIEAETREACAALVQNFTWTLPLFSPDENINVAAGQAANIVTHDLATAIRAAGKDTA